MDELLKAITELVRTGNDLAWPVVVMFFVQKSIVPVITGGIIFYIGKRILDIWQRESEASLKDNWS